MTILTKAILASHGPYIKFAECPSRLTDDVLSYPSRSRFEQCVFFELAEDLLGVYCSVTNTGSPIDPYEFEQLGNDFEIRKLTSELLIWTFELTRLRSSVFNKYVREHEFYTRSFRPHHGGEPSGEDLRLDMIETLLMLVGRFSRIARRRHWLVIQGI